MGGDRGDRRTRRITLRTRRALTLLTALLAVALGPVAGARAGEWYGLTDQAVTGGQLSPASAAGYQHDLGATAARVVINWDWIQHQDTTPKFSTFDAIYRADLAQGIHPLFVLTGAPPWTWAFGTLCLPLSNCNYPPDSAHDTAWQAIVAAIAGRYPELAGLAIWTEPNETWSWAGGADPARYTQLLKLAYTAAKAVNPELPVIGGELATDLSSHTTSSSMPLPTFLQDMYDDGARGFMDGIAIHPYPQSLSWWYSYKAITTTTELRDENHDTVPLWVTEVGMSTTAGWSEAQQSEVDSNLISPLLADPDIAGVFVNQLMDVSRGAYRQRGYGVLSTLQQPKPAFCALANEFPTGYRCPVYVLQTQPTGDQKFRWQAQNLLQDGVTAALSWHAVHGSYAGLTSTGLNNIDSRISAIPAPGDLQPGTEIDSSQLGVYPMVGDGLLLCNSSKSTVSYCVYHPAAGVWAYGNYAGTIYQAAYATIHGQSQTW